MFKEVDIKEAVMAALDGKTVFGFNPVSPQDIYSLTEQIINLIRDGDCFITDCPENAFKRKPRHSKNLDDNKIKELYEAGQPVMMIADEMGCSKGTIYAHLRNLGLKLN